jgi:hypothetical protein
MHDASCEVRGSAGCQPAKQRTASPRYDGCVAPIGNRLYRGVALRKRARFGVSDTLG